MSNEANHWVDPSIIALEGDPRYQEFLRDFNKKYPSVGLWDSDRSQRFVQRAVRFLLWGSIDVPPNTEAAQAAAVEIAVRIGKAESSDALTPALWGLLRTWHAETELQVAEILTAIISKHFPATETAIATLPVELKRYLDTLAINSNNIGDIRRSLFVPWKSKWNGTVRDETAEREIHAESPDTVERATETADVHLGEFLTRHGWTETGGKWLSPHTGATHTKSHALMVEITRFEWTAETADLPLGRCPTESPKSGVSTLLEWVPASEAERLTDEGKLGKDVYCIPLFQDSLTNSFSGDAYVGTSLVVYNRGAWRGPDGRSVVKGLSHFAIMPIFPLRPATQSSVSEPERGDLISRSAVVTRLRDAAQSKEKLFSYETDATFVLRAIASEIEQSFPSAPDVRLRTAIQNALRELSGDVDYFALIGQLEAARGD